MTPSPDDMNLPPMCFNAHTLYGLLTLTSTDGFIVLLLVFGLYLVILMQPIAKEAVSAFTFNMRFYKMTLLFATTVMAFARLSIWILTCFTILTHYLMSIIGIFGLFGCIKQSIHYFQHGERFGCASWMVANLMSLGLIIGTLLGVLLLVYFPVHAWLWSSFSSIPPSLIFSVGCCTFIYLAMWLQPSEASSSFSSASGPANSTAKRTSFGSTAKRKS